MAAQIGYEPKDEPLIRDPSKHVPGGRVSNDQAAFEEFKQMLTGI